MPSSEHTDRRHLLRSGIGALLSGILTGLAFPSPLGLEVAAFGGLVPILLLVPSARSAAHLFALAYAFGFGFHGTVNWWVSSWQAEADPYLLLAGILLWLGHPLFFVVPLAAYWFIARRFSVRAARYSMPFIWCAFEWLHSLGELGYPWLSLGHSQALTTWWIQVADIAGVWGASFLIVLANVALLEALEPLAAASARSLCHILAVLRSARVLAWLLLLLAILLLPQGYGRLRVQQLRQLPAQDTLRAVLVQPDLNPWAKWERLSPLEQIRFQQRLADSVLERFPAQLIVWNETAIPISLTLPEYGAIREGLMQWLATRRAALLSGMAELELFPTHAAPRLARALPWDPTQAYLAYNSAILLTPEGIAGVHRKIRLTPFAERFPYAELFGELSRLVEWNVGISAWTPGAQQTPLLLALPQDTVRLGVAICLESIYPDFLRTYARQGAHAFVVISNDAWFDHTPGPLQHYAIARVRAIETRRPILRCANSGITAALLPTGEVLAKLPQYRSAALAVALPLSSAGSLYATLVGDTLPMSCGAVALTTLLAAWVRARRQMP